MSLRGPAFLTYYLNYRRFCAKNSECIPLRNKEAITNLHKVLSTNSAMMTPQICNAHVFFTALRTSRTGFPVVFKGGQKMQAILMR